jgi:ATP-dependent Zn protease
MVRETAELVQANGPAIARVADALMERRTLNQDEVDELMAAAGAQVG